MFLFLFPLFSLVTAHPQCLDFQAPFHPQNRLYFCRNYPDFTCCTNRKDLVIYRKFYEIQRRRRFENSNECRQLLEQILCTECDPYAAHIYDAEAKPGDPLDFPGLCHDFCRQFFDACQIYVPDLTTSSDLLGANSVWDFCHRVNLSDSDYCYPNLLTNPSLTGELQRTKDSGDSCLCVQKMVDGLRNPVFASFSRDDDSRLYILEQKGIVWSFNSPDWTEPSPFIDITDRVDVSPRLADERGLLGIAFHPDFHRNRRFYLYYTGRKGGVTQVRVSQFTAFSESRGDVSSEQILLEIPKPNNYWNHNGGMLVFGVDGYLYAVTGDGGGSGDPGNRSQNISSLLGKALRLDVSRPATDYQKYRIPWDNPFQNEPGAAPEVWAYGLRNAWRCSFDRGDAKTGVGRGRFFCGDVGQGAFEEVDIVEKGKNYGWRAKEGFECYKTQECANLRDDQLPIWAYPHSVGKSVIGGYVYRGCRSPNLQGLYIYGDFLNGRLFRLKEENGVWENREIHMCTDNLCTNDLSNEYETNILSFSEDFEGEIYMLATRRPTIDSSRGTIYKLVDPRRRTDPSSCILPRPI